MAGFKISTNIERDANTALDFIVTKNANEVYDKIVYFYGRKQHAFTIIGSYGTGKSTFLWAFERHLKGEAKFATPINGAFKGIRGFDFVRIVGETLSLKDRFCEAFGLGNVKGESNRVILREFNELYKEISKRKHGLVILLDEFGKHLEYIARTNPDEMYFIQELAEFCNDEGKEILLISTLHQNFSVYSKGLTKAQRSEWDKVRGRFVDLAFDEPVEQLLFFAAKRLTNNVVPVFFQKEFEKGVSVVLGSHLLGQSFKTLKVDSARLFPLDPLAADILTRALQRYGQNERSLFTFLDSPELQIKIAASNPFSVADCFDYLISNLRSEIEDGEKNPFKPQWKAATLALEKAEFIFAENYLNASQIIKLVCLVNIFSNASGTLNDEVIIGYAESFLGIKNCAEILDKLKVHRIVKFSNHRSKYNFIEGTDVDIEQELIYASQHIDSNFNIVSRLNSFFNFPIITAKRVQFERGTPRFFAFRFYSDMPSSFSEPVGEVDGYINLVFTKSEIELPLRVAVQDISATQIFVLFKEFDQIQETLFEIEKVDYVISKFSDDKVALRILNEEKQFRTNKLKALVEGGMFSGTNRVIWIWNEKINKASPLKRNILSFRDLNRLVSDAAEIAYPNTPVYRNEMVNKEHLSTPILTARKALIRNLIGFGNQAELGFDTKKFPPEKTIYLTLLKETGIHRVDAGLIGFGEPTNPSFVPLWEKCNLLLDSSRDSKVPVFSFIKELKTGSFKLKQGFVDFWVPIFLILKKEDYSLYYEDGEYIPHLTTEVMDLIYKHPKKYFVKALSTTGIQSDYLSFYKELTDYNESNIKGLKSSYITIYGNFLRFYRNLEDYSKKTKNLPKTALAVRNAISNAIDPETALFQSIPQALGYFGFEQGDKRLNNFLTDLQFAVRHIRGAYDLLIDSLENEISEYLKLEKDSFGSFKVQVQARFATVNRNLIMNEPLKIFYARLISPLDVQRAYWESLCDSILGKKLDKLNDDEVPVLLDRLKANFDTLQNLAEIHSLSDDIKGNVFHISIMDKFGSNNIKRNIVISDEELSRAREVETQLISFLTDNETVNKAALIALLGKTFLGNE